MFILRILDSRNKSHGFIHTYKLDIILDLVFIILDRFHESYICLLMLKFKIII